MESQPSIPTKGYSSTAQSYAIKAIKHFNILSINDRLMVFLRKAPVAF